MFKLSGGLLNEDVDVTINKLIFDYDENISNHDPSKWKLVSEQTNKRYMKLHKPLDFDEPARTLTEGSYKDGFKHPNFRLEILNTKSIENYYANKPWNDVHEANQTITTIPPYILGERSYRRVTVREMARLQSFPDDFLFKGSKSSQYKMVGNAVCPLVAYNLATNLYKPRDEEGEFFAL
jgi:site-specific DNA-cytosine methylase